MIERQAFVPTKGRILVVDDEPAVRDVISDMLLADGYETKKASDGDEALVYLNNEHFDLVVLDIIMPKVNGLEVIEGIKQTKPELKIIVLSAIGKYDENFFDVVIGKTVDAFLEKPVKMVDLLSLVARLLN